MKLLKPVEGIGNQEVSDFRPAVIKDVRAPIGMLATAGVSMFVESRAIKAGKCPVVLGEVRGHPVNQYPDPGLVQPVN